MMARRDPTPWRVEIVDGEPLSTPRTPLFTTGAAWRDIQVSEVSLPPTEMREGYLLSHVVTMCRSPIVLDVAWPGQHRKLGYAPGTLNAVPAGMAYTASWERPFSQVTLGMTSQFLARAADPDSGGGVGSFNPRFCFEDPLVSGLVSALAEEARAGNPAGVVCAESLAAGIVARLFRRDADESAEPPARGGLSTARLRRVLDLISVQLGEDLSLGELATESGLSLFHFVRSFKDRVGLSPHSTSCTSGSIARASCCANRPCRWGRSRRTAVSRRRAASPPRSGACRGWRRALSVGLRSAPHLRRRTVLTLPLVPPPQKNRSAPSDSSPETFTPGGISIVSSTSPVRGSTRLNSLASPSQVPCQSSPSTQVTPVTKRLDSIVRRIVPVCGSI
jgi:AraC family transcriptional regulator